MQYIHVFFCILRTLALFKFYLIKKKKTKILSRPQNRKGARSAEGRNREVLSHVDFNAEKRSTQRPTTTRRLLLLLPLDGSIENKYQQLRLLRFSFLHNETA